MRKNVAISQIVVEHEYFDNSFPLGLSFEPFKYVESLLSKHRAFVKNTMNGFVIFHEYEKANQWQPFLNFDNNINVIFFIKNSDTIFNNYTDLPFYNPSKQGIYIKANLEENEIVVSKNLELVNYSIPQVTLVSESEKIEIISLNNELLETIKTESLICKIDLSKYLNQVVVIKNGDQLSTLFVTNEKPKGIGILQLELNKEAISETKVLKIKFSARNIFWKYIIEQKFGKQENLKIVNDLGEEIFLETDESNENIRKFESKEKIKLLKHYTNTFKLESVNRTIKEKLPCASPLNLKFVDYDVNKIWIDIIISI